MFFKSTNEMILINVTFAVLGQILTVLLVECEFGLYSLFIQTMKVISLVGMIFF